MEMLLREIETCLAHGQKFAAITLSLLVPEICANLSRVSSRESGESKKKYIKWFDQYAKSNFNLLDGTMCYQLRCGLVHAGAIEDRAGASKKTMFLNSPKIRIRDAMVKIYLPGTSLSFKNTPTAYAIDLQNFCEAMVKSAKKWLAENVSDETVQTNIPKLLQLRPNGMPPYIIGAEVIG